MDIRRVLDDIRSPRKKRVIIDTDAANEADDQFAIAYALGSDRIDVLSINAAPFLNANSTSYGDGMEKSRDEVRRILNAYSDERRNTPVFEGSRASFDKSSSIPDSAAARNIIETALSSDEVTYILGIAAATNIAAAIEIDPSIVDRIAVIWLASNALDADGIDEFNLYQDYRAGQILIDSGVPLLLCPAWCVTSVLGATLDEFRRELVGTPIEALLLDLIEGYYCEGGMAADAAKIVWDIAAPAILSVPECAEIELIPAPILTDERRYAFDAGRHEMMYLRRLDRTAVYGDMWRHIGG